MNLATGEKRGNGWARHKGLLQRNNGAGPEQMFVIYFIAKARGELWIGERESRPNVFTIPTFNVIRDEKWLHARSLVTNN